MYFTSTDEINLYLSEMKTCLKDKKSLILKETDKNYKFKYLYKLDRDFIIKILNSLQPNEFDKKILSIHKDHLNELLFVWNPLRVFIDASGNERILQLYIKTHLEKRKKLVIVISFHEYRDYGGD